VFSFFFSSSIQSGHPRKFIMIRSTLGFVALATLSLALALPVFAGGGGGGSKGNIAVRMKNVGAAPVAVNSVSGSASLSTLISGARTVAANGVSQFNVRKGAFSSLAADPNNPQATNKVRSFNTRSFKTIYLYAQQDTTAATLVGAPGGVKF
jgi:hypothetical protein